MISVFDRVENIVGKGENAGCQHFLLFPQCFQKSSFLRILKYHTMFYRSCVQETFENIVGKQKKFVNNIF